MLSKEKHLTQRSTAVTCSRCGRHSYGAAFDFLSGRNQQMSFRLDWDNIRRTSLWQLFPSNDQSQYLTEAEAVANPAWLLLFPTTLPHITSPSQPPSHSHSSFVEEVHFVLLFGLLLHSLLKPFSKGQGAIRGLGYYRPLPNIDQGPRGVACDDESKEGWCECS